jgi:hypothetical protein
MKNMQTLEGRFIYFAECQLATLEMLEMRKGTSKSDLRRQKSICDEMLEIVATIAWTVDIHGCPRVMEFLKS